MDKAVPIPLMREPGTGRIRLGASGMQAGPLAQTLCSFAHAKDPLLLQDIPSVFVLGCLMQEGYIKPVDRIRTVYKGACAVQTVCRAYAVCDRKQLHALQEVLFRLVNQEEEGE